MKKYSDKNRYTPFSVLVGQNVPVNDVYSVVMPDHMIFTYHFIVWAEYQAQVNKLVERLNFEAEDYWGDKRGFRFQVKIDSISHTIQLSADQNRMVKSEFDMQVFGYLLPDVIDYFSGKQDTTQKFLTPKKIVMGTETVSTNFPLQTERDINAEKWRSQNYPNLPADTVIPAPPVVPDTFSTVTNNTIINGASNNTSTNTPTTPNSSSPWEEVMTNWEDETDNWE